MPGLVPGIHVFHAAAKTWMPATSAGMTADRVNGSRFREGVMKSCTIGKTLLAKVLAAPFAVALASAAQAQTYGFASMQPGSINHTTSSAISKVLKEKGGLNTLVQA